MPSTSRNCMGNAEEVATRQRPLVATSARLVPSASAFRRCHRSAGDRGRPGCAGARAERRPAPATERRGCGVMQEGTSLALVAPTDACWSRPPRRSPCNSSRWKASPIARSATATLTSITTPADPPRRPARHRDRGQPGDGGRPGWKPIADRSALIVGADRVPRVVALNGD